LKKYNENKCAGRPTTGNQPEKGTEPNPERE